MYYTERHNEIIAILKERHAASVHDLAKRLYVSEPTIRRDLLALEKEGKIRRTFGGAVLGTVIENEIPLVIREQVEVEAKRKIADRAAEYIRDGQVLFLDASSTVFYLLERLAGFRDLTVITNSPKAPLKLAEMKINCICTGGMLLKNAVSFVGPHAEGLVRRFNADLFFFSCRGLSEDGLLTDSSVEESELRRVMMAQAQKNILLCTGEKLGKKYLYSLCTASELDGIICDRALPPTSTSQR